MSLNLHTAADYYLRSWGAWLNPNLIPDPDALSGDTGRFNNMRALTKIPTVIGKTSQVFQDYFVQWAGDYPQGFTDPTNSNFSNFRRTLCIFNMDKVYTKLAGYNDQISLFAAKSSIFKRGNHCATSKCA